MSRNTLRAGTRRARIPCAQDRTMFGYVAVLKSRERELAATFANHLGVQVYPATLRYLSYTVWAPYATLPGRLL
jgi:hypothetical protein